MAGKKSKLAKSKSTNSKKAQHVGGSEPQEEISLAKIPLVGSSSVEWSRRDLILVSLSLSGVLFAGGHFSLSLLEELKRRAEREKEQSEIAFRILFGDAKNQYYVPAINNPYSPVKGITLPTRDAFKSIVGRLGFTNEHIRKVESPFATQSDGSILLFGGPVPNIFSRQILGAGEGSPLFSQAQQERVFLPVYFGNIFASQMGVGHRPQYQMFAGGKRLDIQDEQEDYLVVTSIPNIFSSKYNVFNHRLVVLSGLHGAGLRAIDLVLRDSKVLAALYKETRTDLDLHRGWQALIRINKIDPASGVPLELGETRVFEIDNVNFDRAHEMVCGQCFWIDPSERLSTI